MADLEFPLQFKRQYAAPLDVDYVFATTAERNAYLTNARRYAGQIVSDLEDGLVYCLSASRDAWTPIGTPSSDSRIYNMAEGQAVFNIHRVQMREMFFLATFQNSMPLLTCRLYLAFMKSSMAVC